MSSKLTKALSTIFIAMLIIQMAPAFIKSIKEQLKNISSPKTKVGFLCIKNEIKEIDRYQKHLKKVFEDKSVKAIFLKIDSPGGYAGTSDALYNEINQLKSENPKPIVVLTENICASGGYFIACVADHIVASPSAIVGSIGSYIGYFKLKELINKYDIKYNIQKSGKYKATLNPFSESTKEEEDLIQEVSDNVYNHFVEEVAKSRKLSLKDQSKWAEGRIFTGIQAKENKLVDEIGSEFNAIKKVKELALIDGKIEFVKPEKLGLIEQLTGQDNDECSSKLSSMLESALAKAFALKL